MSGIDFRFYYAYGGRAIREARNPIASARDERKEGG
jgi:hypothetical protein